MLDKHVYNMYVERLHEKIIGPDLQIDESAELVYWTSGIPIMPLLCQVFRFQAPKQIWRRAADDREEHQDKGGNVKYNGKMQQSKKEI